MAKAKIALLYERLSRDNELSGDSFSIQNQKIMLEDYAHRNGYPRFKHFTDDGVSGTRFDRPGFMAMMEEVEDGNVEAIIVKDMSRLGRDYLKVGQVMEILRQRGVRLIAINDNVDSANGDNDFTPFLKITPMPLTRSIRTISRLSTVFRAKRERDLVRIRSMRPRLQAAIIRLNSVRFFMLVPVMPLSAKIPAISQSGFSPIFWV